MAKERTIKDEKVTASTDMKQRIIMFRAWDKDEKVMLQQEASWRWDRREFYPVGICVGFSHYNEDEDNYILMQYTGLKDKNGMMIFEGDNMGSGVVKFQRGAFVVEGKDYCHDLQYVSNNLVVSGNIYEGVISGT